MTDNPTRKKCIVRRGLRHVEMKSQHSNEAFSVMFCGSASGDLFPPMVLYKAQNCYINWTQGGVLGSLYDATKSGWFDMRTFEVWFF